MEVGAYTGWIRGRKHVRGPADWGRGPAQCTGLYHSRVDMDFRMFCSGGQTLYGAGSEGDHMQRVEVVRAVNIWDPTRSELDPG
jgi:hypothetical protein